MSEKMREILFRGKRLCNDKWMVGNLICCENGERYICCVGSRLNRYKVDPETVGQFTGLTDKNGKKIFEGDILKDVDGAMDGIPRIVYWSGYDMAFNCPLVKNIGLTEPIASR